MQIYKLDTSLVGRCTFVCNKNILDLTIESITPKKRSGTTTNDKKKTKKKRKSKWWVLRLKPHPSRLSSENRVSSPIGNHSLITDLGWTINTVRNVLPRRRLQTDVASVFRLHQVVSGLSTQVTCTTNV